MSAHLSSMLRDDLNGPEGEQIMEYFRQQVLLLKEKALLQASVRDQKKLMVENAKLKKDIEELKKTLEKQQRNKAAKLLTASKTAIQGTSATFAPSSTTPSSTASSSTTPDFAYSGTRRKTITHKERDGRKNRAERKEERPVSALVDKVRADVSRLDLRVGRIINVTRHPRADALYVQEVELGEATPRTVVSTLAKHVPLEQPQGHGAVLLCNLRPNKIRGVWSQAMVLCASSQGQVEVLEPPRGATPGDRVTFQSYPGEPDSKLSPKQKVWEQVQADLRIDAKGVATYRGAGFEVRGKGLCKAPTLRNSDIK